MRKISKYLHCFLVAALYCMKLDPQDPVCLDTAIRFNSTNPIRAFTLIVLLNEIIVPETGSFYSKLTEPLPGFQQKLDEF
jgi:hypothetical protein